MIFKDVLMVKALSVTRVINTRDLERGEITNPTFKVPTQVTQLFYVGILRLVLFVIRPAFASIPS